MKSIYKLLFEGDEELAVDYVVEDMTGTGTSKQSSDSVDYQIDQFLIQYDQRAVAVGKDAEEAGLNESLANRSLKYLLAEQDEDPFAEDEGGDDEDPFAEDEGGDEGGEEGNEDAEVAEEDGEDVVTNAEIEATEPADIPKPPINVDTFVTELNRLLAMPQNVLSLRTVIINRAKNYLLKNYDSQHVQMFEEVMSNGPYKLERFPRPEGEDGDTPIAVGAYAGGTGGMGGGG